MPKGKDQHVVPHNGNWGVRGAGNSKITVTSDTKKGAVERGREIARNQESELVIHGRDGRIQQKDSHGRDPNPPRDKD